MYAILSIHILPARNATHNVAGGRMYDDPSRQGLAGVDVRKVIL